MATGAPNYFRVVYSMVNNRSIINTGRQILIDATSEQEAIKLATERLTKEFKWHKITGCFKA